MIYLYTGLPGASKTLNSLYELCSKHDSNRFKYYINIRLLMLDFNVCDSFQGWFYGYYYPQLKQSKDKNKLKFTNKILKDVHLNDEFVSLQDFPNLKYNYETSNPMDTFVFWVNKCYPKKILTKFNLLISEIKDSEAYNFDSVKHFNFHFNKFEDATKWYELPNQSVILIDESQEYFQPRGVTSKKPTHIGKFETHRHHGYDVYLITQDSKLIDVNIRRLVGRHIHFYNALGGDRVTRTQASKCIDPDDYFQRKQAETKIIKRPTHFYGSYWSSELHTHKFKVPKFIYYFFALVFLVIVCFYYVFNVVLANPELDNKSNPVDTKSIEIQKSKHPLDLKNPELKIDNPIIELYTKYTSDLFIDGSLVIIKAKSFKSYQYSFYNIKENKYFYPESVGLKVFPVSECLALVRSTTIDFQTSISCNPFHEYDQHEDDLNSSMPTLAAN